MHKTWNNKWAKLCPYGFDWLKKNTCWASRLATNSHLKSKPDWDNPKKANGKLLEPTIAWRANGNLYTIWDSVAPLPRILWKTHGVSNGKLYGPDGQPVYGAPGECWDNTAHVNWNSVWWWLGQSSLFFPSLLSWLSRVYTEFSLHGLNWQRFYFSGSVCMCACVSLIAKSDHSLPELQSLTFFLSFTEATNDETDLRIIS